MLATNKMFEQSHTHLFCVFVFFSWTLFSQSNYEMTLFTSNSKKSQYYLKTDQNQAYLIQLNSYFHKAERYTVMTYLDTLTRNKVNEPVQFTGKKASVEYDNKQLLLILNQAKKPVRYVLDPVSDTSSAMKDFNSGIWWNAYLQVYQELKKSYPLFNLYFHHGFSMWDRFPDQNEHYLSFQNTAAQQAKLLKDSLVLLNTPWVTISNELLHKIDTISYERLKTQLLLLPMDYRSENRYFETVLIALCNRQPELFYKLAEDLSPKKEMLFDMAHSDKNARKNLKKVTSSSPLKKEFKKYTRKQTAFAIGATTLYTSGMIAFWGWIIHLIVR